MSKSPSIFLPALGVAGLVLGAAYGLSTRGYKAEEAQVAMRTAERAEAAAEAEAQRATELSSALEMAEAEAARVSELSAALDAARAGGGPGAAGDPMPANVALRLGRAALAEEVAAWNIDVRPDGQGLPEGRGDVLTGEEVFVEKCAACHGDFGEAVGRWPVLAGGQDTLDGEDPVKTIGSYWPYLSTVFDYVNRAMPFGHAQSLTADEVYAITAQLLYLNDLVDEDFELSHENFADLKLPNEANFYTDDREVTEYAAFTGEPCMADCKDTVEITGRARVIDVTPDTGDDQAAVESTEAPAAEDAVQVAAADTALIETGEVAFKKCKACHQVGDGATDRVGPQLNGIFGRTIGGVDGFKYSGAFASAADEGRVWDEDSLSAFLADPRGYFKGTKMSFRGFADESDIAAVLAYLRAAGG